MNKRHTIQVTNVQEYPVEDYMGQQYFILMSPGEGCMYDNVIGVWGEEALQKTLSHWEKTGRIKVPLYPISRTEWHYSDEYEPHSIVVTTPTRLYGKHTTHQEVDTPEYQQHLLDKALAKEIKRHL